MNKVLIAPALMVDVGIAQKLAGDLGLEFIKDVTYAENGCILVVFDSKSALNSETVWGEQSPSQVIHLCESSILERFESGGYTYISVKELHNFTMHDFNQIVKPEFYEGGANYI